ncbi:MAG: hypothetical protein LBB53_04320 [Prevotellaceae bacterium]|jgi:hypothetical protein|nr:hypothetical protein [Prevotellaceae bacterium]
MAIDEKQIGEEMHAIISNRETGKIALMVRSLRYSDLQKLLNCEESFCREVETLWNGQKQTKFNQEPLT